MANEIINEGGPAFAQPFEVGVNGRRDFASDFGYGGMSLRDWFAGQALAGLLACAGWPGASQLGRQARDAYRLADAMVAQRDVIDLGEEYDG